MLYPSRGKQILIKRDGERPLLDQDRESVKLAKKREEFRLFIQLVMEYYPFVKYYNEETITKVENLTESVKTDFDKLVIKNCLLRYPFGLDEVRKIPDEFWEEKIRLPQNDDNYVFYSMAKIL